MSLKLSIPNEISNISTKLKEAGYEAYLVGGCTRDLLIGRKPKDWDFTTNATPEQIVATFGSDETFYENDFGTVTVKNAAQTSLGEPRPPDTGGGGGSSLVKILKKNPPPHSQEKGKR